MDAKESELVHRIHNKFIENSFDELDVYSFFILIREKSRSNKFIREMGDFIAHREKSKGDIKDYLERNENILINLGKAAGTMKIDDVFSFKQIRNGINNFFTTNGLTKLSNETINCIILCMISILQEVKLFDPTTKREIGKLIFALSSKNIFLNGEIKIPKDDTFIRAQFPVLSCKNVFHPLESIDRWDTPRDLNGGIIKIVNKSNKHIIKLCD
ncbi:hypothetical protein ACFQO8_06260 [Exiguobacterium aestuarii]|uniref:Uncharacterized protein n=1 Tax=Exiguobacterium aestuarii TaxID=273527 RepID=A0ABW2PKQ1_9BACL|nr:MULTISPECIES: hypothetical protein [Exiguobacterium]MCT4787614.1 hypothetical protein [Exiguobacterium aestuarii]